MRARKIVKILLSLRADQFDIDQQALRKLEMVQVLTMPIFFASNAIYRINLMPGWWRQSTTRHGERRDGP
jgi:hypothetical protein